MKRLVLVMLSLQATACFAQAEPSYRWVKTGKMSDWGGSDIAHTSGASPKLDVKGNVLCGNGYRGRVAVCFDNEYPNPHINTGLPTPFVDLTGTPGEWCTYKDSHIRVSTRRTGTNIGFVWECRVQARRGTRRG